MDSLCHPWFTTTNLSYRFPIFETSATALCGTTGNCICNCNEQYLNYVYLDIHNIHNCICIYVTCDLFELHVQKQEETKERKSVILERLWRCSGDAHGGRFWVIDIGDVVMLICFLTFYLESILTYFPAVYLAHILTFYLTYIRTYCLAFYLAFYFKMCILTSSGPGALHSISSRYGVRVQAPSTASGAGDMEFKLNWFGI